VTAGRPAAGPHVFSKMAIANRGEIAVRIVRACAELGIPTLAFYSEADAGALHVELADEALCCGPGPALESYLRGDHLISLARQAGADAVHPGYGFLSENEGFARACRDAGLVFVGPRPETIRALGDKIEARRLVSAAGVPIVPGAVQRLTDAQAVELAAEIGYPLMVKAAAGGGGRGMRRVREASELAQALARARSEAQRGFGDDGIYIEKCLEPTRHIEVQVLGDAHGNHVHLFERECSIQRRHQKLVEEGPAPRLTPLQREDLARAALAAAKAAHYEGTGTVEFLLDAQGQGHFLEMNTRIQVEHPVTEMITGIDLLKAGIRIAAGRPLEVPQSEIGIFGCALEFRIYAEDPDRGFLPSPGTLTEYLAPGGPGVRVDSGVRKGSTVPVFYDALLAKLICWGRDRAEALARSRRALREFRIEGVKTTLPFHLRLLEEPAFLRGEYTAGLVEAQLARAKGKA
jgi:acetyl-CoA carboxylase, biotin carboxylase subunit